MKETHWYLRGWEYEQRTQPDGSVRQELVYKGEYYQIRTGGKGLAGIKAAYVAAAALLWAVLAVLQTHIYRSETLFFEEGACALTLIPAIYMAIGSVRALGTHPPMTYRDMRASFGRIRTASKWCLALMAICLAGELFYLVFRLVNGYAVDWSAEGIWLVGGALGVLASATELALLRRFPVEYCPVK